MSVAFKKFLNSSGIVHLISCPYTPYDSGTTVRKHMHIIETTVIMIFTAHFPHNLWFHGCSHAVFIINRMPCKSLAMQSPFFKLFGYHPDLILLKCLVQQFSLILDPTIQISWNP